MTKRRFFTSRAISQSESSRNPGIQTIGCFCAGMPPASYNRTPSCLSEIGGVVQAKAAAPLRSAASLRVERAIMIPGESNNEAEAAENWTAVIALTVSRTLKRNFVETLQFPELLCEYSVEWRRALHNAVCSFLNNSFFRGFSCTMNLV